MVLAPQVENRCASSISVLANGVEAKDSFPKAYIRQQPKNTVYMS